MPETEGVWTRFNAADRSTWPPASRWVITPAAYGGFVDWRWFDWEGGPHFENHDTDETSGPERCDGWLWMLPPKTP